MAYILDKVLGEEELRFYNKSELGELIKMHGKETKSDLVSSEAKMMVGAMTIKDKLVKDEMILIENVDYLNINDQLTNKRIISILDQGHTRLPVISQWITIDNKNHYIYHV